MFNNKLFFIFAKQTPTSTFVPQATGLVLYRDFVADKQLNGPNSTYRIGPSINFIRNSQATYINSLSTITTAIVNEPRFNYTPSGQYLGLLIEDQVTNLVPYSTDFTQTWSSPSSGVTVTPNVTGIIAPDGTETATLLQPTTAFDFHVLSWNGTPAPAQGDPNPIIDLYNRSIFVKKETARYVVISCSPEPSAFAGGGNPDFESVSNIFDLDLPGFTELSVPIASYEPYINGWYRLDLRRLSSNTNTNRLTIGVSNGPTFNDIKFAGDNNNLSGVYIWGGQVEEGPDPTSYIFTNGSAAARAADNAFIEGSSFTSIFNLSGGTYFTTLKHNSIFDSRSIATFTSDNGIKYLTLGTNVSGDFHTFTNTSSPTSLKTSIINANQFYNLAIGFEENNFALYQNNTLADSLTAGSLPQLPFRIVRYELGQLNNTKYLNGHIQKLGYYPTRLANEQLSAL
jgi:hypothetical protein